MDRLIKHIIVSLYPLIEAYSPKVMQQLMDKFKAEVEDFEIEDVTDDKIETYIKRFDQIKNSPKVKEKDLFNWTLPDLIRLITSSPLKGDEKPIGAPEDIVYTDQELEIYDASNEDRCIALKSHDPSGRQESWCIGRGSFDNHRFNERKGFPSYYYFVDVEKFDNAAGDANHDDFADSFFVVSINNKGAYVYTDRTNSPNYSREETWDGIESRFNILKGKNVKDKVKYLPLSDEENMNQKYSSNAAPIRDFRKFSFNLKKQYLIARKDSSRLFRDMDVDEFAGKVLPKYKEIMDFVAVTPGIIDTRTLLKNLESYNNNNVKSIIANLRERDLGSEMLEPDILPWKVRKLLVKYANGAFEGSTIDDRDLFVSKDEKYIFLLQTSGNNNGVYKPINLEAWSEYDHFENVKLTPRTEQYLEGLDLSKYPEPSLLGMATKGQLKIEWVKDILEKVKKGEFKEISYKKTKEKEYFANFTDLSAFTIEKGSIKSLDFNSEEVQKTFAEEATKGMIQILSVQQNIPNTVNIGQLKSAIDSLSIEDRTLSEPAASSDADYYENPTKEYIAFTDEEGISLIPANPELISDPRISSQRWDNTGRHDNYSNATPTNTTYEKYFEYLRDTNQYFTDGNILNYILGSTRYWGTKKAKQKWAANNPPLSPDSAYVIMMSEDDEVLIINKEDPKRSKKVSNKSGKLIKLNLSVNKAIALAGDAITATPGRRGRTAGTTAVNRNAPLPELEGITVQSVLEDNGLAWDSFPDKVKRKLHYNAMARSQYGNRGATRRRNMLGYRANIINYYTAQATEGNQRNAIYIIRVGETTFASIVMQPGNNHYVVTTDDVIKLSSPSQLADKLRDLNILNEIKKFIIKEYLYQKNNTMKSKELKKLVKEAINEVLKENLDDYRLEPENMDNPDEDLVIIGSGYLDIKSNFGERPSQTNGEYAEIGQKVVDQLHNGDKEAALNYIYSRINENEPQQAPDTETPDRETIPYSPPKPGEKKRRRRIGNPDADPNPKAMYEMEQEILGRIAKRFNKMKDD